MDISKPTLLVWVGMCRRVRIQQRRNKRRKECKR